MSHGHRGVETYLSFIAHSACAVQAQGYKVGDIPVNAMAKISIACLGLMLSAQAPAQDMPAAQPGDEKINQLIIYGDDKCPESTGDEIVVCARMGEADRFRIPSSLRGDPNDPRNQAMSERIKSYEYVAASGTMSCSPSGAGGFTGCGLAAINKAYAEKAQDPGITFGRLIAAERSKRMAGIDAEAAEVEQRVQEFEKGRAEREAKLQAELEAKEAAGADAEPLPEPK
ncbi:hypothetical protein [Sphingorhabdus sp.]|uniref:hypothetical protein n=1 Tax=Sphingorhabdus sp. TaxID=1902408 RepID=UPI00398331AA